MGYLNCGLVYSVHPTVWPVRQRHGILLHESAHYNPANGQAFGCQERRWIRPGYPAVNPYSGAQSLLQLNPIGFPDLIAWVTRYGGPFNPRANTLAILPRYRYYWHHHPYARPGAGAVYAERSEYTSPLHYAWPLRGLPWSRIGDGC